MTTDMPDECLSYATKIFGQERRKRLDDLIKGVYSEVRDGRILDIGMGKWSLIKDLFPELYVVGIDFVSPSLPPDEFFLGDIRKDLPFKDGEFSMVFAGEVIEHMGFRGGYNLLREISRVLRSNGYLLFTTPNGFRILIKKIFRRATITSHEKEFSSRELKKTLGKAGLKVIHADGIQPLFVPWSVTTRFTSLELPCFLSQQLIFLCQKSDNATI